MDNNDVTIDGSNVGGDLFNIDGGYFNKNHFNITNNNINSFILTVKQLVIQLVVIL